MSSAKRKGRPSEPERRDQVIKIMVLARDKRTIQRAVARVSDQRGGAAVSAWAREILLREARNVLAEEGEGGELD